MAKYLIWLLVLVVGLLHCGYVDCCIEEERLALLEIVAYMRLNTDPTSRYLASWFKSTNNERRSSSDCCQWEEVRCNVSTGRVTHLDLSFKVLYGHVGKNSWLFNVTLFRPFRDLISLDLSENSINGLVEDNGSTKISTLKNLKILKLYGNTLMTGYISLSACTSLRTLMISGSLRDTSFNFKELTNMRELQKLDLTGNFLNITFQELTNLRELRILYLSENYLNTDFQGDSNLSDLLNLRELQILDLSYNNLTSTIQGLCELRNLQQLQLEYNSFMHGSLPSCIRNLSSLEILDLSYNQFNGKLPSTLSNLTSLKHLDLSSNNFEGKWSLNSLANHSKLQVLRLSGNILEVQTEDSMWLPTFQLQELDLEGCNLNKPDGTIPKFLLHQYNLSRIDLSNNNLIGYFPNWLLSNNSELTSLSLANNSFVGRLQLLHHANSLLEVLDISENNIQGKVPENIGFILSELEELNMSSNHFKGHIPTSLGNMRELVILDLSDNFFSGELPRRLFSDCGSLNVLLLSNNNLQGELIPEDMNLPKLGSLKLGNNKLGGKIKDALQKSTILRYLDISYNKVIGGLPQWIGNFSQLLVLTMSRNHLQGHIPREVCRLTLVYLDLSHNNFSGRIPSCNNFSTLSYMHLAGNSLTGEIPSVLSSCSQLQTLDLKNNQLSGGIPYWINKLSSLSILLLAENDLHGQIPHHMCQLRKINLLDLSHNNLSGKIPTCLGNMSFGQYIVDRYNNSYQIKVHRCFADAGLFGIGDCQYGELDEVEFLEKNHYLSYTGGVLLLMSGLDLSCNKFTGVIPSELGNLREIHSLNLSHNHLTGSIPSSFSRLRQIESLDLSWNNLSGTIPPQLVDLTFLSAFNVSYNSLTGRVPEAAQFADFDGSSYIGNPGLYGFTNSQLHNQTALAPTSVIEDKDENSEESYKADFLWSFGMSCVVMFLATVAILYINPQWRQAWFDFVDWRLLWWTSAPLLSL